MACSLPHLHSCLLYSSLTLSHYTRLNTLSTLTYTTANFPRPYRGISCSKTVYLWTSLSCALSVRISLSRLRIHTPVPSSYHTWIPVPHAAGWTHRDLTASKFCHRRPRRSAWAQALNLLSYWRGAGGCHQANVRSVLVNGSQGWSGIRGGRNRKRAQLSCHHRDQIQGLRLRELIYIFEDL